MEKKKMPGGRGGFQGNAQMRFIKTLGHCEEEYDRTGKACRKTLWEEKGGEKKNWSIAYDVHFLEES